MKATVERRTVAEAPLSARINSAPSLKPRESKGRVNVEQNSGSTDELR